MKTEGKRNTTTLSLSHILRADIISEIGEKESLCVIRCVKKCVVDVETGEGSERWDVLILM